VEQTCSIRVVYDAKKFSSIIVAVRCVGIKSEKSLETDPGPR
jgi:hypothetical protein